MSFVSNVECTRHNTSDLVTVAVGSSNVKGAFPMRDKKKCLHTKYQFVQRRGSISQLNPTEVYHAGTAFVKRRIQDEQ